MFHSLKCIYPFCYCIFLFHFCQISHGLLLLHHFRLPYWVPLFPVYFWSFLWMQNMYLVLHNFWFLLTVRPGFFCSLLSLQVLHVTLHMTNRVLHCLSSCGVLTFRFILVCVCVVHIHFDCCTYIHFSYFLLCYIYFVEFTMFVTIFTMLVISRVVCHVYKYISKYHTSLSS